MVLVDEADGIVTSSACLFASIDKQTKHFLLKQPLKILLLKVLYFICIYLEELIFFPFCYSFLFRVVVECVIMSIVNLYNNKVDSVIKIFLLFLIGLLFLNA